ELETFQKALQEAGGNYQIHHEPLPTSPKGRGEKLPSFGGAGGGFYCPMHCEGDKTYDQPGDCPVCGMDLVEAPKLPSFGGAGGGYTCPMHPEIVQEEPGSCPICGMDLVPKKADELAENKTYKKLLKKFKIAVAFTLPIF